MTTEPRRSSIGPSARALAAVCLVSMLGASCGDDDGGGVTPPPPTPPPGADGGLPVGDAGEEVIPLEDFLRDNHVVTLEAHPDGGEIGRGTSDAAGVVHFYSPEHEGLFSFDLNDADLAGPVAGVDVMVSTAGGSAAFVVVDPRGTFAPMMFASAIPEGDATLEVDTLDLLTEGDVVEFDPARGDPFMPFTILGVSFSMSISGVLRGIGIGIAAELFGQLVNRTCSFFAPVHMEMCEFAGGIASSLAAGFLGAIRLGPIASWGLGRELATEVLEGLVGTACEKTADALIGYNENPNDTGPRNRYREVAYKYNYLLYRSIAEPPADASGLQASLRSAAPRLSTLGRTVRDRYFELYNRESSEWGGFAISAATEALQEQVDENPVFREWVIRRLTIEEGYAAVLHVHPRGLTASVTTWRHVEVLAEQIRWQYPEWEAAMRHLGGISAISCFMGIVKAGTARWMDGAAAQEADLSVQGMIGAELDVWNAYFDWLAEVHYGEVIPPPACLADEHEPNGTWQEAVASPVPVELSPEAGVIHLRNLTLCDYLGTGAAEEDWYAYYVGPIELNVQARVTNDMIDPARGADEPLCLDVYFFSEIYTIEDPPWEPTLITTACGTAGGWPSTSPFGIRRTLGESWSMMLLRVRPDTGASGTPVDYNLRFTP
ncbi:MAG: hypothetical protein IT379_21410 [Deltaproteobacteria bacterium]|nr:hypothetical protein [Deltaproteobacteria bacterium]